MKTLKIIQNKLNPQFALVRRATIFLTLTLLITSCQSLKTAIFDQYAYQQAISLKVESLDLMDEATEPYSEFEDEVETLMQDLHKMVEYEKNRPNNEVTLGMWNILANKDKNLLAGFFKRWEENGQLSSAFTNEAKQQVSEALDLIINYESQKNKTNESNILGFLNNN